jgi:peptidoglycan hydrolase-like protein with peptidoglycan-binding domain
MIVLHHADASTCSPQDIHWWHIRNGWSGIGYHYFVNKQGVVFKGRPDDVIGSHTKGYNSNSIGICFEGRYNKEIMPQIQLQAGKEIVEYLKKKYNIVKVKRHKDLIVTDCPGSLFPFEAIVGEEKENLVLSFQRAATADGFKFPKYGCDGQYGSETQSVMQKCIVKRRILYKYKNVTKLAQRLLGIKQDGLAGKDTEAAIKKFQQEHGLSIDGCCGPQTWLKLLKIK